MMTASDLESRLRKLERQNRRLRLIAYTGLVALAGGVLMAMTGAFDDVFGVQVQAATV